MAENRRVSMGVVLSQATYCGLNKYGTAELALATLAKKCGSTFGQTVVKAIMCNWLVCMAVFLAGASDDMAGKMVGIWYAHLLTSSPPSPLARLHNLPSLPPRSPLPSPHSLLLSPHSPHPPFSSPLPPPLPSILPPFPFFLLAPLALSCSSLPLSRDTQPVLPVPT